MLEQVGAELVDQLVLDPVVAGAVLRGEPHGVLVGGVDARDGGGAVLVHLAGELAGELHRADLRAEEAPEGALHEGSERGLHGSQRIHRHSRHGSHRTDPGAMLVRRARAVRARRRRAPPRGPPQGSRIGTGAPDRSPASPAWAKGRPRSREGRLTNPLAASAVAQRIAASASSVGAASAHHPRQDHGGRGPERGPEQQPEAQQGNERVGGRGAQRALPRSGSPAVRPPRGRSTKRRVGDLERQRSKAQPPVAEGPEQRARAPAGGLAGECGKGSGEAREAEHGREQRARATAGRVGARAGGGARPRRARSVRPRGDRR